MIPAIKRRKTPSVGIGTILIGGSHPVAVQSMTNTPTQDVEATVTQTEELIQASSELVRITVNDDAAAMAVPQIVKRIRGKGYKTPIIGDFHFNGHTLLTKYPDMAKALDKYRINPGNVGRKDQHDNNFATIIKTAIDNGKAVRIGVNAGSLDPEILQDLMDKNAKLKSPKEAEDVTYQAMVRSALDSAEYAVKLGLKKEKLILSAKISNLQGLIKVNTLLAQECHYALHLGLTEAGSDIYGISSSSAALGILLQQGIGDTIRVSLTPQPGKPRSYEVEVCKSLLQSMGLRYFEPSVTSCPGCGRTTSDYFQHLAIEIKSHIQLKMPQWKNKFPGVESLSIAVMGCVVNGPGESKHANIGISLPGTAEKPVAPVYVDGKKVKTLSGDNISKDFIQLLEEYIDNRYTMS